MAGVIGRLLYGALFVVVVPLLLMLWAAATESAVGLQGVSAPQAGWTLALVGAVLMALGVFGLWRHGRGLPMNAFPPPELVTRGVYAWVPHPIYTGFVCICAGVSMIAGSASGLWLITPAACAGSAALVLGYEHQDLQRRFGRTVQVLPEDSDASLSTFERVRFHLLVTIPWIALYEFTVAMKLPGTRFALPFEPTPVITWTAPLYWSTYPAVAFAPWLTRTRRDLRQLIIAAWFAMALVFPFYWFVPSAAPRPDLPVRGLLTEWLDAERDFYPPSAAFPSFHVLWAFLIARYMRPRFLGKVYVATIAVSCVTTGMHYIPDVLAGFAVALVVKQPGRIWRWVQGLTERLANSWVEWRFGSVRVIDHGLYAGLASFAQAVIVMSAVGSGDMPAAFVTCLAGLVGAGVWAQWVEGSSRLRRPFGFYGGLIGTVTACLFFEERWTFMAAHCLAAPWMQAIGRLRCLVNGCCHGAPAGRGIGICVVHPRSRVVRLASLGGTPIHATQLYSILGNVAAGLLLAKLWSAGVPASLIGGVYLIANGAERFAEEAYRGEPQTHILFGLRLHQWLAVTSILSGALITCVPTHTVGTLSISWPAAAWAAVCGVVATAAMGVDLPESERPLARLT